MISVFAARRPRSNVGVNRFPRFHLFARHGTGETEVYRSIGRKLDGKLLFKRVERLVDRLLRCIFIFAGAAVLFGIG